jgi:flagellar operon protein
LNEPVRVSPTSPAPVATVGTQTCRPTSGPSFADLLDQTQGLRFSNHAQKRLQTREISLNDDGLNRLINAVDKAEKRGGRESLVLMDGLAFIVDVPGRTVVTAMNANSRSESVFTQIDSVVIADNKSQIDQKA